MKLYRINALLMKYFYITINKTERIFDMVYWPVLELITWGFTSTFINQLSEFNVLSMLLGGAMLWVFIWRSSQDIAVYFLEDFWSNTLYHTFSSPVKISENTISIVLFGFMRAFITFLLLTLIAFLVYSFNFFSISILYIGISIFILLLFGLAIGLLIISLILTFGKRVEVLTWSIIWIVQPFSCVFYPLSSLPSWAVPIAKAIPITYVFENLRNILYNNTINYSGFLYAFIMNIFLVLLAGFFLYRSFERARKTGLLAKAD